MSDATDVLHAIDQLRRDLTGYHGQLKAHNDLQRHCENQRKRIVELEGLYAKAKTKRDETAMAFSKEHDRAEFLMRENTKLRALYAARDEPIIRCKDCKHYELEGMYKGCCLLHLERMTGYDPLSDSSYDNDIGMYEMPSDGFCSSAKRRET